MSASVRGPDALNALKPLEVASYLRVHGWRQEADLNGKGSVWLLPAADGREEADITLPLQRDLGDFALRMGDVLRTLRQVERRSEPEILQDLVTTSSDLIRVRAPSREAESGSLPLEQAVAFVERSRDLVLAAACAAITKRAYFATRKPDQGHGVSQQGADGPDRARQLRADHPVAGRPGAGPRGRAAARPGTARTLRAPGHPHARPRGWRPWSTPRDRRRRPAAWLRSSRRSAWASRPTSARPWPGLSAVSPGEGLDISIAWSRTRPAASPIPSRIVLGSDSIPLIQEAARLFKDTAPVEDVEIQGFVTRLARGPTETQRRGHAGGPGRRPVAPCHRRTGRRHLLAGRASPRATAASRLRRRSGQGTRRLPAAEPAAFSGP